MQSGEIGSYESTTAGGEQVRAFVPQADPDASLVIEKVDQHFTKRTVLSWHLSHLPMRCEI